MGIGCAVRSNRADRHQCECRIGTDMALRASWQIMDANGADKGKLLFFDTYDRTLYRHDGLVSYHCASVEDARRKDCARVRSLLHSRNIDWGRTQSFWNGLSRPNFRDLVPLQDRGLSALFGILDCHAVERCTFYSGFAGRNARKSIYIAEESGIFSSEAEGEENTMNRSDLAFLAALAVFLLAMILAGGFYYFRFRRNKKFPYGDCGTLLKRLDAVDRRNIERIAASSIEVFDHLEFNEDDTDLEPSDISGLIGGLEGLEAMKRNCAVLIDLAFYVQQWHPEAIVVAEHLRLNSREIEWHIESLKGTIQTGKFEWFFPEHAERVTTVYYLMTRQVLNLFEIAKLPALEDLQRAL